MNPRNAQPLVKLTTLVSMIACIAALGCTTTPADDDNTPSAGTGVPAGGAGAPAAGAGAGGAAAGAGGAKAGAGGAGGAAGMAAMPIMCGTLTCNPVMTPLSTLPPCCDAANGNICGGTTDMMGGCTGLGQKGTPDMACPMEMSAASTMLPGCCRPDAKCGVQSASLMGCVERSKYPLAFLMGAPTTPLMTMPCTTGGGGMGGGGAGGAGGGGAGGAGGGGAGGAGGGGAGGAGGKGGAGGAGGGGAGG